MIGWFKKTYLHKPIKILQCVSRRKIQKFLTSKYFSIFNNKTPACWVAHIARGFIAFYSCLYCSFMIKLDHLDLGSRKVVIVEEELDDSDMDDIGNFEDLKVVPSMKHVGILK